MHDADRVVHGRADELVGAVGPQAEFDALAVDEDELAVGGQGAVGDDQLEGDGLAASWFPADEHVPLCEVDVDRVAGFVGAQVDRVPDRQGGDRDPVMVMRVHLLPGATMPGTWCPGAAFVQSSRAMPPP